MSTKKAGKVLPKILLAGLEGAIAASHKSTLCKALCGVLLNPPPVLPRFLFVRWHNGPLARAGVAVGGT